MSCVDLKISRSAVSAYSVVSFCSLKRAELTTEIADDCKAVCLAEFDNPQMTSKIGSGILSQRRGGAAPRREGTREEIGLPSSASSLSTLRRAAAPLRESSVLLRYGQPQSCRDRTRDRVFLFYSASSEKSL
jgi:hypothetical protein